MNPQFSAKIPYSPQLDAAELPEVANRLEENGTRLSVESLNWPEQFPYRPLTVVSAAHSDKYLYLDYLVRCNYLRAVNYTPNSPVNEDSCVEFFASFGDNPHDYITFSINCIGIISAKKYCGGRESYLSPEELAQIRIYASVGTRPFQEVEGSFIWSITVAIPLSLMGLEYAGQPLTIRANFNKCASATSQPHYLSWAPITSATPDFHRPDCFGTLVLE